MIKRIIVTFTLILFGTQGKEFTTKDNRSKRDECVQKYILSSFLWGVEHFTVFIQSLFCGFFKNKYTL